MSPVTKTMHNQPTLRPSTHCRSKEQEHSTKRNTLPERTFISQMLDELYPTLSFQPCRNQVHLAGFPLDDKTPASAPSTLEMPSSAFHDPPDSHIAEGFVSSERAFLQWTLELLLKTVYQPVDFQMDAGIDQVVEMAAGVFQRQSVRVR